MKYASMILAILLSLSLGGCIEEKPAPTPHQWAGKWIGPEGTFLNLTFEGDNVTVVIQSLDSQDEYEGMVDGTIIRFERENTPETIHAGAGEETGMKWLLTYKNCLIIQTGEGFCRE